MKFGKWLVLCACVSWISVLGACGEPDAGFAPQQERVGYGEECSASNECEEELDCVESVCAPQPTIGEGEACAYTEGCQEGLYCDPALGVCAQAGAAAEGESCGETADCAAGLTCVLSGFSGTCTATGQAGQGASCEETTDCAAGLNCVADLRGAPGEQICDARPLTPTFRGAECAESVEGDVEALFDLPGGAAGDQSADQPSEFYRLPFPNDIRLKNGHPDMTGHATPGPGYIGFDIVQRYIDAVKSSQDHYGLNQTVYFRFSNAIDFGTLKGSGENSTIEFVDIDGDSPSYNSRRGMSWRFGTAPRSYICRNWLSVRPQLTRPLRAETTYAVVLRTGVKDSDGADVVASEDFKKLLADTKPDDVSQADWDAYGPLRDWASEQGIDKSTLINAAVFTTGNPRAQAAKLREAARASTPALTEATLCDEAATSPCDDGLEGDAHTRGCMGTNDAFHEVHAKLTLPVFQEGDAPYTEEGGAISVSGDTPQKVRDEAVCAAMTVPKTTMPDAGWPLLIYAHGTGGTFRNHVGQISPLVTSMAIDGVETGMVVMGWDQVLHYTRRGDSDAHPNGLVYNYANPDAARGNFLQGAADIHALVAFAENFSLGADESPTGEELRFDPTKIYFMGHSQGGTTGPLALPFDDTVQGAVLSGAGAHIGRALLGKTSPLNAKAALMAALQDPDVGGDHPVISILQGYFDSVDPLNYGAYVAARQLDELTFPSHVFHYYGVGDTYTPPDALEILAHVMRVPYIGDAEFGIGDADPIELPVSGNMTTGEQTITAVGRQYTPDGYDGHFVAWRNAEAMDDLVEFLGSAIVAEDGVPTISD